MCVIVEQGAAPEPAHLPATTSGPESGEGAAEQARPDISGLRILVVDDSAMSRTLLEAGLRGAGYGNLRLAGDGVEALETVDAWLPDLVLLDLSMPRMDGFELCRRLRAAPRTRTLPILVQSGLDSIEELKRAFDCGASDMIVKPVQRAELLARVRVHLENRAMMRSLTAYRDRVRQELELARRMQAGVVPSPAEVAALGGRNGLAISSHFEPSSELGGDLWGLRQHGEALVAFMADFSGHGVAAALNTFRLHTLIASLAVDPCQPGAVLAELNASLCRILPTGTFATMLWLVLHPRERHLVYAAAGAPAPLVGVARKPESLRLLDTTGLPLGVSIDAGYEERHEAFPQDGFMLLYSDALIEAESLDGSLWGEDGLLEGCAGLMARDGGRLQMTSLLHSYRCHIPGTPPDDLTLVLLGGGAS